jgi:hypothetical protein
MRKYNDSVKPGCGIDGSEGENFTRQHNSDLWNPPKLTDGLSDGRGRYTDNQKILREKKYSAPNFDDSTYNIDAAVEANQPDSGNRGIKSSGGQS